MMKDWRFYGIIALESTAVTLAFRVADKISDKIKEGKNNKSYKETEKIFKEKKC